MSLHPPRSINRWSLTILLVGAVTLGACGGGSDGKGAVASLSGKSSSGSSSQSTKKSTASFRTQLLAYAKCMRDNGIDFPDPQFDADGRPQFNRQGGGAFADLRTSAGFQKAAKACESKRPDFAGQFQLTPEQQAQARTSLLKFAKCMRSKGIDFPDPTFDANGRPQFNRDAAPGGAEGQNREDTAARTAREACQKEIGGNGVGPFGGRGPGGPPAAGGRNGSGTTGGGSGAGAST